MHKVMIGYKASSGKPVVSLLDNSQGGRVGYSVEENYAKIWWKRDASTITEVYPLDRVTFIREETTVV